MLEVGSILSGRFRIERILGQGGMGVVAVATHLQLDQQVAIKVLHETMSRDADIASRLLREAQASARLRSDHVCKVFDVGRLDGGAPYIVMELLDGSDLQRVIRDSPLPIATAVDHVLQACVAIAEAHALGIVHRDLKPANLFLTRRLDGSPLIKVLDFGIAKAPAADEFKITRTSTVMGSPGYMSPEQLRSAHDVDARSDIWALGVILYELVSGRLPFRGTSITELAVKVTVDAPEPLDIDAPVFAAAVLRCLEKSADRRYQTVAELAAMLAPFGGDIARRSAMTIAALAGGATAAGASAVAMSPRTAPPTQATQPAAGKATTLQTAAAESTGDRMPVARRSRAGLVVAGVAVAAVVATIALFATGQGAGASKDGVGARGSSGSQVSTDGSAGRTGSPATGSDLAVAGSNAAGSNAAGSNAAAVASSEALRGKLRALAAAHDWSAVLQVAELDRGDPEVAAIARDARQQYLGQQGRAIDAQGKLGNCARARQLAAAAHQVVADDATLEARARACKPLPAMPQPPTTSTTSSAMPSPPPAAAQPPGPATEPPGHATAPQPPPRPGTEAGADAEDAMPDLADAQNAVARGDWARALSLAQAALRHMPRSPLALRLGVISACHLHDEKTARALMRRVPLGRQRALRQQCAAQDVLL